MPFYSISGKWYHLSYSHHFSEIEEANSPKDALFKVACNISDADNIEDVEWEGQKPKDVLTGALAPRISFQVGADQIYQIRSVQEVQPVAATCPECNGSGVITSFA